MKKTKENKKTESDKLYLKLFLFKHNIKTNKCTVIRITFFITVAAISYAFVIFINTFSVESKWTMSKWGNACATWHTCFKHGNVWARASLMTGCSHRGMRQLLGELSNSTQTIQQFWAIFEKHPTYWGPCSPKRQSAGIARRANNIFTSCNLKSIIISKSSGFVPLEEIMSSTIFAIFFFVIFRQFFRFFWRRLSLIHTLSNSISSSKAAAIQSSSCVISLRFMQMVKKCSCLWKLYFKNNGIFVKIEIFWLKFIICIGIFFVNCWWGTITNIWIKHELSGHFF